MCGICGAAWTNPVRALPERDLDRMIARLAHRGPDDAGSYIDAHAALGFRRLSIIDLAGAHQPLANEDGTVWVVYNGEIYNFPALRRRLEARGHRLRSTGDTEVLVHLYEDEGPELFPLLRGMFAIAIWDSVKRTLVLGRDRLGQKPLLYRLDEERITFASELKAILALPVAEIPRDINPQSLDQYLMYGYIAHPQTILSGIHKLPPAHRAVWHDGRMSIGSYWSPDWNQEDSRPETENAERLRELLADAVREQMISDVPLGAFLSGGVDSTVIAGLMKEAAASGPIKTFTIGFDDPAFDESRFAELAANHLKTEHQTFVVEPRAWETLPALSDQFDEPFADSSALPTWYVSKYTREHVTVALTGDAGDELFGGYDRYRALALGESAERLPRPLRSLLAGPVASRFPASVRAKTRGRRIRRWLESLADPAPVRYLRWMTYFDEPARMSLYDDDFIEQLSHETSTDAFGGDPATLLQRAWNLASRRDSVTRAMVADLSLYLPCDLLVKVDLASMAHSLECRGPFLDHRVVEFAMSLPIDQKLHPVRGESKRILKRACADMLPPEIAHRPKMGFGVPIDRWFRGELRNELREVLLDPRTLARGFFRRGETERLIAEHAEGRMDHAYRLWSLLMLELWFRHHMDQAPPSSDRTDSRSHSPTTIAATPQPAHEPS